MINDNFNRVHDYLRISVTENCNFNCFYCRPPEKKELNKEGCVSQMTAEEIISLSKTFIGLGIKKIRLTGGEPFVRKDIGRIILQLSKLPAELSITTNGYFINRYMDILHQSTIRSLNISLDSLLPARFWSITQKNALQKIYDNILLLLENNFHVKVNMVVVRGVNDKEVLQFIEWTKNYPLHVRFIEFMPFDGNRWDDKYVVRTTEILEKISSRYCITKLPDANNDTAKKYRAEDFIGTFAIITTVSDPFCASCNRIRISSSGKIRNCLFSTQETDILTPMREGKCVKQLIHSCITNKHFSQAGLSHLKELSGLQMSKIGG